jgi:hypothetical protein
MDKEELNGLIARVKSNLSVTKVVVTRSVKTRNGDYFAGFAAAWNTVQDDAGGPGADMDLAPMTTADQAQSGMSLKEAITAHTLLALEADTAAYGHARVNGALSDSEYNDALAATKNNHAKILRDRLLSK